MAAMQLDVTFRNIESSEALKAYAREKVERVNKYVDRPMEAHVVLSSERHEMHADIRIHVHQSDLTLRGKAKEEDMYASVDVAMDKIERQLRRYKEKLKNHKPSANGAPLKVRYGVLAPEGLVPEELLADGVPTVAAGDAASPDGASATPPAEGASRIVRNTEFLAKPMTVDEAVMQMDSHEQRVPRVPRRPDRRGQRHLPAQGREHRAHRGLP